MPYAPRGIHPAMPYAPQSIHPAVMRRETNQSLHFMWNDVLWDP